MGDDLRALMMIGPLVLLAACGGKPPPEAPKPAAATVSDFSKPMYARGTDPTWGLTIQGTTLSLSRAGQADVIVTAPGAVIQPNEASWTATLPDGQAMKATLYASECIDPVSGTTYPFSAEVIMPGAGPLNGCAYKTR
jgi:uncharacterized membrane protein